jgi:hypothetical protein
MRKLRPDSSSRVVIATANSISEIERQAFVDCFYQYKSLIYDQIKKGLDENHPPRPIYFNKVYFLK